MPTRAKLVALAQELRHARTGLLSLEVAERVQHTIARIEHIVSSPILDVAAAETLEQLGRELLDECEALLKGRPQ